MTTPTTIHLTEQIAKLETDLAYHQDKVDKLTQLITSHKEAIKVLER